MPTLSIERLAEIPEHQRTTQIRNFTPAAKAALRLEAAVRRDLDRYSFRGASADLEQVTDPEMCLSGPAGTGKSLGILYRIFDLAAHNPGLRALFVRKTAVSLTASGLVTWRTKVIPESLAAGAIEYYGGSAEEPPQYRFWNGSKVMVGGMDNPAKVMSTEYDLIFVQEAIEVSEADWEALTSRLRNGVLEHMQLIGDTNPSTPTHWLKERVGRGVLRMLESRHEDNPTLFERDGSITDFGKVYIGRLDRLSGVRLHRLRYGRWVAAEGIIYEQWDEAVHLIDPFPIPAEWPRIWGVDFGYTNPFVCQWWALDPDGRLYLYREWYKTQTLVEDHAKKMLALCQDKDGKWIEPKPRAIVCDHDAEGRATLKRYTKLPTLAANKEVRNGIEAVMTRLRPAGDGKPRLFIMRGALVEPDEELVEAKLPTCTEQEITGYVWAPSPEGKVVKEDPLKLNDHGMDTLRYVVRQADRPPPTIHSF